MVRPRSGRRCRSGTGLPAARRDMAVRLRGARSPVRRRRAPCDREHPRYGHLRVGDGSAALTLNAVHQFLPSYAVHDAIGGPARQVRSLLRGMGLRSDIYAGDASRSGDALPVGQFERTPTSHDTLLLYHLSTGSSVAEFILRRPERKVVNYHNVTPARFFDRWEPQMAAELTLGRR